MRVGSSNKTIRVVFYASYVSIDHVDSWHALHRTPSLPEFTVRYWRFPAREGQMMELVVEPHTVGTALTSLFQWHCRSFSFSPSVCRDLEFIGMLNNDSKLNN